MDNLYGLWWLYDTLWIMIIYQLIGFCGKKLTGKFHRNHGKIWLVSGVDFPFFVKPLTEMIGFHPQKWAPGCWKNLRRFANIPHDSHDAGQYTPWCWPSFVGQYSILFQHHGSHLGHEYPRVPGELFLEKVGKSPWDQKVSLWLTYKKLWEISMCNGKTHYFYGHFPWLC